MSFRPPGYHKERSKRWKRERGRERGREGGGREGRVEEKRRRKDNKGGREGGRERRREGGREGEREKHISISPACWEDHKDVCEINAFQKTTSAMSIPTRNHGNVGDLSDPEEGLSGVDEGQGSSDDGEG